MRVLLWVPSGVKLIPCLCLKGGFLAANFGESTTADCQFIVPICIGFDLLCTALPVRY